MDGHRAPREPSKADLAKEGAQGSDGVKRSVSDLIVGTSRVHNNGMKQSRSSNHCKLRRFGNSADDDIKASDCAIRSLNWSSSEKPMVKERIRRA
jgi:hypothetical protein